MTDNPDEIPVYSTLNIKGDVKTKKVIASSDISGQNISGSSVTSSGKVTAGTQASAAGDVPILENVGTELEPNVKIPATLIEDIWIDDSQIVTSEDGWTSPTSDDNIPSEKLVKNTLDTKLDKETAITGTYAYTFGVSQSQTEVTADTTAATIVQRDANGHVIVPATSVSDTDGVATSKGYVDTGLESKLDDNQLVTSWSGTVSDTNIPSEKLTKDTLDTKLNKVTTSTTYPQAYVKGTDGTQGMRDVRTEASANTIAYRDANSTISVGTPTANAHATTKKYVDDADASKLDDSQLVTSWSDPVSDSNIPSEKLTKDTLDTKLDKVTSTSSYSRAYAVNTSGGQIMWNVVQDSAYANSIARRTPEGKLFTATPVAGDDGNIATNKTYVDTLGATKVDKTNSASKVYVTDGSGEQTNVPYDTNATASTIPIRDSNGVISVGTPTANAHATTKDYVDTGLGTKQGTLTFDSTPTDGSSNPVTSDGIHDFVNSSISTNTANFKGTFDVVTDLGLTTSATDSQIATALAGKSLSPTNNDYVFVYFDYSTDPGNIDKYERFKYNGTAWAYEYTLNNSSFTAQQWATINTTLGTAATCNTGTASGNVPIINSSGLLTVGTTGNAATATSATSATQDGSGNTITTFYQQKMSVTTATLATSSWSGSGPYTKSVSVTGVTASNNVFVSPAPASFTHYGECGIYCSAQGSGTLTFTATTVPTSSLTVNVAIFN